MRIFKQILIVVILISCSINLFAQNKSELEKKKKKAQDEINYTNKLLKETKESQKSSYNNLVLIGKNIDSRRELIDNISTEVSITDQRIRDIELIIGFMQDDIQTLKSDYAEMVKVAWKNSNKYNTIMFILAAEDFNQTYLRLKYMQQLADFRKKQFMAINSLSDILFIQLQDLNKAKNHKTKLLDEEKVEEQNLKSAKAEQERTLTKLKSQEQDLKKKLQDQQKQMASVQREIEKLIAEESKRTSGSSTGKYALTPAEKIVSTNFGNNKGSLPWPVERGVIVSGFGKQMHPVLTSVEIDNKGVDISTTSGSIARAVFEGEVRKVFSVPGAQTAVIIRHGEYLSVYTHLDNVLVSVGESVVTKQAIGTVHTDKTENKTILHLEIWKSSTVLNPSGWLAK